MSTTDRPEQPDTSSGEGRGPNLHRYPRKPTESVVALRFLGHTPGHDEAALNAWGVRIDLTKDGYRWIWVERSQAWCLLGLGSYVIQEADGTGFYPCTDRDFNRTYDIEKRRDA